MFPQFFKNLLNNIDVGLAWIFSINKNIIWINNDKNIKLFGQDLIDIILKTGRYVGKPKKYYLVLKVAILSLEGRLPFIALFYPQPIVNTCEIKFGKLFGLTWAIWRLADQWQQISIFDCEIIEPSVIDK